MCVQQRQEVSHKHLLRVVVFFSVKIVAKMSPLVLKRLNLHASHDFQMRQTHEQERAQKTCVPEFSSRNDSAISGVNSFQFSFIYLAPYHNNTAPGSVHTVGICGWGVHAVIHLWTDPSWLRGCGVDSDTWEGPDTSGAGKCKL